MRAAQCDELGGITRIADDTRPFPSTLDAFTTLVDARWDAEAARRPHSAHATVAVHLDVEKPAAHLHLGPLLTDAERRYLLCDGIFEAWFEKDGQVVGSGRSTRQISRRYDPYEPPPTSAN